MVDTCVLLDVGTEDAEWFAWSAETLRQLAQEPRPVQVLGVQRPHDVPLCVADLRAVERDFAWRPRLTLAQGLADVLAHADQSR